MIYQDMTKGTLQKMKRHKTPFRNNSLIVCFDGPRFLSHLLPNRLQIYSYNRQGCTKFSLGVLSLGGQAAQLPSFVFSSVDKFAAIGKKKEEKEA